MRWAAGSVPCRLDCPRKILVLLVADPVWLAYRFGEGRSTAKMEIGQARRDARHLPGRRGLPPDRHRGLPACLAQPAPETALQVLHSGGIERHHWPAPFLDCSVLIGEHH